MSRDQKNHQPFDDAGLAQHIAMGLSATQPSGTALAIIYQLIKRVFQPTVINAENVPSQPCLFISNHSLFALDAILLTPILIKHLDRFPRVMTDRFLWSPTTEKTLLYLGGILGDRQVCNAFMENGHDLILFPGGAHEAVKTAAEKYQLKWKQRYGFVKLAAYYGYTIVPLAQVGPDDFYSHLIEGEDLPDSNIGKLLQWLGLISDQTNSDMIPPLPAGLLGSLLPKPQHCYYQFGEPIDLSKHKGKQLSQKQLHTIRTSVSDQIEDMIEQLLAKRDNEKNQAGIIRRLLTI